MNNKGKKIKVHLYNYENILMPKGSMKKESIGAFLLEQLNSSFNSWTDKKYGDIPSQSDLVKSLYTNLMEEVNQAWLDFIDSIPFTHLNSDQLLSLLSVIASLNININSKFINRFIEIIIINKDLHTQFINYVNNFNRQSLEFNFFSDIHKYYFTNNKNYLKACIEYEQTI